MYRKCKLRTGTHLFQFTGFLLGFLLLLLSLPVRAQPAQARGVQPVAGTKTGVATGATYAVVIGISDYENPNITDLSYADKDAAAFVQFLRSPAGGAVPEGNIVFLANENATAGQVASAMDGLLERCKEGDRAIIYFSGHGDVERNTISQPGFLLCRDAPASVYMGGGTFPLIFLQEIISTLSIQNGTSVIVFADACRAGKLAGTSIGGSAYTARNMAKLAASETKILSCQPDELSLEGKEWGGGRGVFSFYLINGMTGLADRNKDGVVTLMEMERYLEDNVSLAVAPHHQMPMVVGDNKIAPIAWVDPASLEALSRTMVQNQEMPLAQIDSRMVEEALLAKRDSGTMVMYGRFKKALKEGQLLDPEDQSAYDFFKLLEDRSAMQPFVGLMRRNLAAAFQDEAQRAINDYLASDPAELRKRWSFDPRYARFPAYLEKAAELLGEGHYLYATLKAREQYFRGLNLRLQGEQNKDKSRFLLAIERQKDALKWDENAAYAFNELGLLARRLDKPEEASDYFDKAVALSPQWALPWANLCAVYIDQEEYDLAITCGQRAVEINPSLPLAQYNLGIAYYTRNQPEKAIAHYRKTLALDPSFADAWFKLGVVYYHEKDLKAAASSWEKYKALAPGYLPAYQNFTAVYLEMGNPAASLAMLNEAQVNLPEEHEIQFNIAEFYLEQKKYTLAEAELKKYQAKEPANARSYYVLARIQAEQNQVDSALKSLDKAFELGFRDKAYLEQDQNLHAVRNRPEYVELIDKYFPKN